MQPLINNLWVLSWSLLFSLAIWGAAFFAGFLRPINDRKPRIGFKETALAFALFLSFQLFVLPILISGIALSLGQTSLSLHSKAWMNLGSIAILGVILVLYVVSLKSKVQWFSWEHLVANLKIGLFSWFLAFPVIVALTQVLSIIIFDWLGFPLEEQMAVKQVKSVQEYPILFSANLFAIIFIVPMIEELLFRGFLQESLLKRFSAAQSILITALLFSIFHFSFSQGMNNVLILSSLFMLACLLGYLKERQSSLLPCIALHATFNGISLVQIFLIH